MHLSEHVFLRFLLNQVLGAGRLAVHRGFWTRGPARWPIFRGLVGIVARRRVSEGGATGRALFLGWVLGVMMLLLLLRLRRGGLHLTARCDRDRLRILRHYRLSLRLSSFSSLRVQNIRRFRRGNVLVGESLPVLFVLLSLLMVGDDLSGHVWDMGGTLSVRLFVDRSTSDWTFKLSVGLGVALLSHISLGI